MRLPVVGLLLVLHATACQTAATGSWLRSEDGYVRIEPRRRILGTAKFEKVISLRDGRLLVDSLRSK